MAKTRSICLLALPRTGSSYLCDLMMAHPQVESHSELFHRRAVFLGVPERPRLIRFFSQVLQASLVDYQDRRLVDFAHSQPRKFLDLLAEQSNKPYLFFKVFPRHLPWDVIEDQLLANREVGKLFLYRDPLQTYVSFLLGRLSDTWSHQDTTLMRVKVDPDEFLAFTDRNQAWQRNCEATLQAMDQPYASIQYETLRTLNSNVEVTNLICRLLESLGILLDPVAADAFDSLNIRPIQNRRAHVRESMSNFDELARALERRGRSALIAHHVDASEQD